jgi:hypothetical protein
MYGIVFFAFVQLGFLFFGTKLDDYSSIRYAGYVQKQ